MPDSDRVQPTLGAADPPRYELGLMHTGLATVVILGLLGSLLWIVGYHAFAWFWPSPIWELTLRDGTVILGEILAAEKVEDASGTGVGQGRRVRVMTGNREIRPHDHVWIDEDEIVQRTRPADVVRVIRHQNGDAIGRIVAARGCDGASVSTGDASRIRSFLDEGRAVGRERDDLVLEMARIRRPLTRLEERLDVLRRSYRHDTDEGRQLADDLHHEIVDLTEELASELSATRSQIEEFENRLAAGALFLQAGSQRLDVPLGQVLEVRWPNRMSTPKRLAVAVRSGIQFLFTQPREANTEGGIFPALFGTVLLVLLMSIAVMPLGVLTAVYMTEYAREGPLLRAARHTVNNLAGVPSIVVGMFGLAFFIYGVGGFVDQKVFSDSLPTPTFGTGGILWASLTLALLTVPVVVVATSEGLRAVPSSWREGATALGATKWQTLRRVVLPAAVPGMLTGLILAVSRAAGEVAPLMLTGVVKLAPRLPLDSQFPFVHLERKFMHLGFHIYDISMQSTNVEAVKPMAFATTLVLMGLVVTINLTAIIIRRRIRAAYHLLEG
jgi:phosphate transport system permease protein